MTSFLTLRCPICVSSDIIIVDIVIGGTTVKYYRCNECEFEWKVPKSTTTLSESPED